MKIFLNIIRVSLIVIVIESFFSFDNSLFALKIGTVDSVSEDTTKLTKVIEEITISAFRTPYQWMDIPASINYISTSQMQIGNSISPVEAINRVPGIIMHSGTLNTNRLTIRGVGSRSPYTTNKIKAYFGDIPLTSGDGETTLEDIEPYRNRTGGNY